MKKSIFSLILVGLHTHLAGTLPQHVLASTSKSLSLFPQQQLSITINLAQSPFSFPVSPTGVCVTEDYGCEQGYCWKKCSDVGDWCWGLDAELNIARCTVVDDCAKKAVFCPRRGCNGCTDRDNA